MTITPQAIFAELLEFIRNARVDTSPQVLEQSVLYALELAKPRMSARFHLTGFECFQPSPPNPTYRSDNKTILEDSVMPTQGSRVKH